LPGKQKGKQRQIRLFRGPDNKDARKKAESLAIEELAARQHDIDLPAVASWMTVSHVLDGFLRFSKEEHEPPTYDQYERFFKLFRKKNRGDLRISQLKKHHVTEWLKERKYNATSQNRAISALKRAFSWAVQEEHIPRSPIEHMTKPQSVARDRILTPDERTLILTSIKEECFREYVSILTLTGCRPGEAARVTAADVFVDRGIWYFEKHKTSKKTGKPRVIYLCPEALEITKRLIAKYPEGPLFRNTRGKQWTRNAVRIRFRKLRKKHPELKGIVAYSYRSSFATDALENGVADATVAALLGHTSTATLHRFYARLSHKVAHLQDAAAKATQPQGGDAPPRGMTA
jgi:integrase/recombinase XerC